MVFAPESNHCPYSDAPRCPIPLPTSSHFFPTLPAFFLPYPVVALVLYPRLFVSSISPEPFPYFCRPVSKLTARRCTKAPVVGVKAGASSTWQPKDWGPGHCLGPDGTQRSPRHPQHGDSDPPRAAPPSPSRYGPGYTGAAMLAQARPIECGCETGAVEAREGGLERQGSVMTRNWVQRRGQVSGWARLRTWWLPDRVIGTRCCMYSKMPLFLGHASRP